MMHLIFPLLYVLSLSTGNGHNLHMTYSKMAVEATTVYVRISFYPDDFELMLSNFHSRDIKGLSHAGDADSLLLPVLKKQHVVTLNGEETAVQIDKSRIESDQCWYLLSYTSKSDIKTLELVNTLLFAVFEDQKNLLTIMDLRTGKQDTFYGTRHEARFAKQF
jgi:hypothetical protein